jgi:hypothetical protein
MTLRNRRHAAIVALLLGAASFACVSPSAPPIAPYDASNSRATKETPAEASLGAPAQAPAADRVDPSTSPQGLAPEPPRVLASPSVHSPWRVTLIDGSGRPLDRYAQGGHDFVLGSLGERYAIRITNPTSRRVEAVVSVDGRDVIDGRPADFKTKRGYVIAPYGEVTLEGFRTSLNDVATFRFSNVKDSYASRMGDARDVGVIGIAFFPELAPVVLAPPREPLGSVPSERRAASMESGAIGESYDSNASAASGSAPAAKRTADARERPGLGTAFGEARESRVVETTFIRAKLTTPERIIAIRYDDRRGLAARGISVRPREPSPLEREGERRDAADPFRQSRFAEAPPRSFDDP